jgi:hypothetical protein
VFIKVGDSITISNHFLKCFAHGPIDLGRHSHLEETRRFFNQELLGPPKTSFDRASLANRVGWTAVDPRRGSPSPLDLETTGTRPAFAVVMFGSNGSALHAINTFQQDLLGTIDYLLARGIIPLMSTVPPKLGKPESMAAIPEMNAIVRAIAQARQVPFMDYFAALQHLPEYGLSKDGVHPRPHLDGFEARGCWLNDEALTASMNVRNLLVLTSLDRVRRFLLAGAPPEQQPPALAGRGSPDCPFEVDQLPFVDAAQTSQLVAPPLPCAQADTSGPVTVYALKLQQRTRLRARLFSDPGAKLRLLLTRSGPSPACLSSADRDIETFAEPGEYRLVVAAAVEQGRPRPGSYRLTLVAVE